MTDHLEPPTPFPFLVPSRAMQWATRKPLGPIESGLWMLLAYAAGPVCTLVLSGLGVAGWVHAAHHRTVIDAAALSITGQVLVALGVLEFGVALILISTFRRAFPSTMAVVGATAGSVWIVTVSAGAAGTPTTGIHLLGTAAIVTAWLLLMYGERFARHVLERQRRRDLAWPANRMSPATATWGGRS